MTELHLDADEWANLAIALDEMIKRETDIHYISYLKNIQLKIEVFLDPIGMTDPSIYNP